MKDLSQVEPRRPISSLPFVINESGSYYLTGNLQFSEESSPAAISIGISNVTLDLMGFTLSSTPAVTGSAIRVVGNQRNIVVQNGTISGNTSVTIANDAWVVTPAGFANGVSVTGSNTSSSRYSRLHVSRCRSVGLDAGPGAIVTDCIAVNNGQTGINAPTCVVSNCVAELNGGVGISAIHGSVTNSRSINNQGDGFSGTGMVLTNSLARANGGDGISAPSGVIAFSKSSGNGLIAGADINAAGATRTGNNPTP